MKKLLTFIFILVSVAVLPHVTHAAITSTVSQTATDVTVSYHYSGVPTSKTYFYSWLSDAGTGTWVNRNKLLTTAGPSSSTVTKDFTVTYDFASLNLQNGTRYVYYIADGTDDSANLLTSPAYFTPGGTNPTNPGGQQGSAVNVTLTALSQSTGTGTNKFKENFTVTPSANLTSALTFDLKIYSNPTSGASTLISENSVIIPSGSTAAVPITTGDLDVGSYTAVLYQGTSNVATVDFALAAPYHQGDDDGVCNPAFDTVVSSAVTATTDGLCSNGIMQNFNGTQFGPWTWKCASISQNGTTDTCTASLSTTNPNADTGTPTCATGPFTKTSPDTSLCTTGQTTSLAKSGTSWTWSCATITPATSVSCSATVTDSGSPTNPTPGSGGDNLLKNPLSASLDSFPKIINAVVTNIVLPVMIPFLTVMLIYSGFLFVIARRKGSTDGYTHAKKTLMYTVIGVVLVLASAVIGVALQGTVNDLLGPSSTTTTQ